MAKGNSRLSTKSRTGTCLTALVLAGLLTSQSASAQPADPGAAREWSHLVGVLEQQLAAVNTADRNLSTFSTQNKLTPKGKAQVKAVASKIEASRTQIQSTLDAANLMAKRSKSTLDDAVKFRKANEAAMAEATDIVSKEKEVEADAAMIDRSAEEAAARKAQAEAAAAARKAQAEADAAARKAQAEADAAARKAQAEAAAAARKAQAEQARMQQDAARREAEEKRRAEAERQKADAEQRRAAAEAAEAQRKAAAEAATAQRRAAAEAAEAQRKAAAEAAAIAAAAKAEAAAAAAKSEVEGRVSALERAAKEQIDQAHGYAQMLSAFLAKPNLTIAARSTAMNHQRALERITSLEKRVSTLRSMPVAQARVSVGSVQADVERQDREVRTTGEAARALIGAKESYLTGTAPATPPPPPPVAKAAEPAAVKAVEAPAPVSHFRTEDLVPMCEFSFEPTASARGVSISIDGGPSRPLPVRARLASGRHTLGVKKDRAQVELRELLLCGHVQVVPIDAPK